MEHPPKQHILALLFGPFDSVFCTTCTTYHYHYLVLSSSLVLRSQGSPSATLDQTLIFGVWNLWMLTDLACVVSRGWTSSSKLLTLLYLFSRVKKELNLLWLAFRFCSEDPEFVEAAIFWQPSTHVGIEFSIPCNIREVPLNLRQTERRLPFNETSGRQVSSPFMEG